MDGRNRRRQLGGPCHCLRPLIRIWGIVTAIVVSGVGVDITVHGYTAGVYIIVASVVIFVLEIKWLVALFIHLFLYQWRQQRKRLLTKLSKVLEHLPAVRWLAVVLSLCGLRHRADYVAPPAVAQSRGRRTADRAGPAAVAHPVPVPAEREGRGTAQSL